MLDDFLPDFGFNRRHHRHRRHRHHHHRHHPRLRVWFAIGEHAVLLTPKKETFMADTVHIDQTAVLSIEADDKAGDIVSPVAFDSPPSWTSSNPSAATVTASADGTTAVLQPTGLGVTTIGLAASINGVAFTATDDITIVAGDVASLKIVVTPQPAA